VSDAPAGDGSGVGIHCAVCSRGVVATENHGFDRTVRGENEKLLEGSQGSDEAAEVAAARDAALEPVQDRGLMSDVDG